MIPQRSEIPDVPPVHHGAFDYAELERLGIQPDAIIDFSVNSNPFGTPPGVHEALAHVPLDRYPDRECLALRRALAEKRGIDPARIVVGNGTAELLLLIGIAFLRPGDSALIITPTFGEYERVTRLMGAAVEQHALRLEDGFAVDFDALARQVAKVEPRLVFWCNPNNPTGTAVGRSKIARLAEQHPHTLFVIDQAYLAFQSPSEHTSRLDADNILQLRSMTKDYALAGLRLGYAVGSTQLIEALARVRPAWNVNALAQAAGVVALAEEAYLCATLAQLRDAKAALVDGLTALGLPPYPSTTHYFLVNVGDGAAFRAALLSHGVMVRDCASFGLPECVRIAARTPDENRQLLEAVRAVRG